MIAMVLSLWRSIQFIIWHQNIQRSNIISYEKVWPIRACHQQYFNTQQYIQCHDQKSFDKFILIFGHSSGLEFDSNFDEWSQLECLWPLWGSFKLYCVCLLMDTCILYGLFIVHCICPLQGSAKLWCVFVDEHIHIVQYIYVNSQKG